MKPKPNTFKNTFCIFIEADVALIENKKPDFSIKSGSEYFYTAAGMYRYSNHWGRLANSKWRLIDLAYNLFRYEQVMRLNLISIK